MTGPNRLPDGSKITRKRASKKAARQAATLGQVHVEKRDGRQKHPGLFVFTMLVLYKNLYLLGITLLRKKLRLRRRLRFSFYRMRGLFLRLGERISRALDRLWLGLLKRLRVPFVRIRDTAQRVAPAILEKRRNGRFPLSEYGQIAKSVLLLCWMVVFTVFNYTAPVFAAKYLIDKVQSGINVPMGLEVVYNGETIGFIHNESEFDAAAQTLRDRFIGDNSSHAIISNPTFILKPIETEDDFSTTGELADKMVQASGNEINWGYGLYIDDRFYGATEERSYVPAKLDAILKSHAIGMPNEETKFVKSIKFEEGIYPSSSFVSNISIDEVLGRYETVDEIYTVQNGDTPTGIAEKLGIPYAQLKELNPDIEEKLMEGQELLTAKARPFLSVKNLYTSVYVEELPYEVEEIETATYVRGYRDVTRAGQPGLQEVTAEISAIDGVEVSRRVLDTRIIRDQVAERVIVGTNDPRTIYSAPSDAPGDGGARISSSGFAWPTSGGYITVGIGGYPGHTGVDIPRPSGTPIYASAAGRVVQVKYGYTNYGNHVMIDHGNGYVTLYAHASALYVSVGDYVEQGQLIAAVGRTGRATGNHLHFEIRYYGKTMNPKNYIG